MGNVRHVLQQLRIAHVTMIFHCKLLLDACKASREVRTLSAKKILPSRVVSFEINVELCPRRYPHGIVLASLPTLTFAKNVTLDYKSCLVYFSSWKNLLEIVRGICMCERKRDRDMDYSVNYVNYVIFLILKLFFKIGDMFLSIYGSTSANNGESTYHGAPRINSV